MANKKLIIIAVAVALGGVLGYLYYRFIGCRGG
jgi:Flp pilus assembly protein CpaB